MFNNKEKNGTATERLNSNSATLISSGTTLTGDVHSDTDLRIDGSIHGNVSSASKIIIGTTGFVEGNIHGVNADVTGKVVGDIVVTELLQLRGQCDVQGNVTASKLQIDQTAMFNGKCSMGTTASIVQMSKADVQAEAN
ncbi:MAG: polymer-forming cytoskeletal protein [Chitinophagaceae bacterium]|nr:polymer-forming cytoskeletal protein [Chitinophagaceae bacterium]